MNVGLFLTCFPVISLHCDRRGIGVLPAISETSEEGEICLHCHRPIMWLPLLLIHHKHSFHDFTMSHSMKFSQPTSIAVLYLRTLTRQQRRQAQECTTLVETQTWLPPDYETCSIRFTEVDCSDAVFATACPPNKVASARATPLFTAAHPSSSEFLPRLASASNESPSGDKSRLGLGLGLGFGVLAAVLVVAVFLACATKLQLSPRSTKVQHIPLNTKVRHRSPSTRPRFVAVCIEPQPRPAPSISSPSHGSAASSLSDTPGRPVDNSPSRGQHPSVPGSVASDLTSITWPSNGLYGRTSRNRNVLSVGPDNGRRGDAERVRQWIGGNAVVEERIADVPAAVDALAIGDMEQIRNPEVHGMLLRQARVWREGNAGPPAAPPVANGRARRNRVHFQPTVEDIDESVE